MTLSCGPVCGIRLLVFQPYSDRILNCLIRSDILHSIRVRCHLGSEFVSRYVFFINFVLLCTAK